MQLEQTERGLLMTLGDVLFDFDQATLRPGAANKLVMLGDFLKKYPDRQLLIEGYTDSVGSDGYNLGLSQRRSDTVRDFLVANGVPEPRMISTGYGKAYPKDDELDVGGSAGEPPRRGDDPRSGRRRRPRCGVRRRRSAPGRQRASGRELRREAPEAVARRGDGLLAQVAGELDAAVVDRRAAVDERRDAEPRSASLPRRRTRVGASAATRAQTPPSTRSASRPRARAGPARRSTSKRRARAQRGRERARRRRRARASAAMRRISAGEAAVAEPVRLAAEAGRIVLRARTPPPTSTRRCAPPPRGARARAASSAAPRRVEARADRRRRLGLLRRRARVPPAAELRHVVRSAGLRARADDRALPAAERLPADDRAR